MVINFTGIAEAGHVGRDVLAQPLQLLGGGDRERGLVGGRERRDLLADDRRDELVACAGVVLHEPVAEPAAVSDDGGRAVSARDSAPSRLSMP